MYKKNPCAKMEVVVFGAGYCTETLTSFFYVLFRLKAREKRMKKRRRKRVSMKKGKMMVTALMVMTHRML